MRKPNKTININSEGFVRAMQYSTLALALMSFCSSRVLAQDHSHPPAAQHEMAAANDDSSSLLKIVRDSTDRFHDVNVAIAEGYALQFGCVTGPDSGAMGLHYVNSALVNSGVLDPTRPQIVIYEPTQGGGLSLIGADFLLIADAWNAKHSGPPELMGQLFHYWETPNRFGLPAFYTLHVWAWKANPGGAFVNWHPNVSCHFYSGEK
jgi:hypothetical protein